MPVVVLGALVLLACVLVAGYVDTYRTVGPIDELQHIDYLYRAADGEIVASGDKVREPAMREEACRGIDAEKNDDLPPCDAAELRPEQFQERGFNTAYIHPPTYYAITGTLARGLEILPGMSNFVTAGRAVGMAWLGLAVVLLWFVFADLGVRTSIRVPLLLLMICTPVTLHASSTITPDATALAAGSATLLAVLRWEARRASWIWPVVVCALAIAIKATNGVAIVVALGYLGVRAVQGRRATPEAASEPQAGADGASVVVGRPRTGLDIARLLAAALAGVALVAVAWLAVSSSIQDVDPRDIPMTQRFQVDSIGYDEIRAKVNIGFTPLKDGYLPPFMNTDRLQTLTTWSNVLVGAGVIAGIAYAAAGSRLRAIALAAVSASLLTGPALVLWSFFTSGIYVKNPPRYALAALPALLVACAVPLEQRILRWTATVFAAWLTLATLLVVW